MMEALSISETSVSFYETTRLSITADIHIDIYLLQAPVTVAELLVFDVSHRTESFLLAFRQVFTQENMFPIRVM
jgi:hypothetical protein